MMDNSALEKLRCLSAGGAKKLSGHFWEINHLSEKLTTDDDDGRIAIRKAQLPSGWRSYKVTEVFLRLAFPP